MPKRSTKPKLGRLEKLNPTDYWQAQVDFQQWLTEAETLELLGEATGLTLTDAEAEAPNATDYTLLIEAKTTLPILVVAHLTMPEAAELGQLLTWAATETVATVIWIAPSFSAEAVLTLDWLNLISEVTFLGLTIDLWRIGKTAMAANFTPIDDGFTVDDPEPEEDLADAETPVAEPEPLTELQQENLDFWRGLCDRLDRQGSSVKPGSPATESTMGFAMARAGFRLNAILDRDHQSLYTELLLSDIDAQPHFHLLSQEREAIADEVGLPLIWDGAGDQACMVACTLGDVDLANRARWPDYQAWFCDCLERFYEAFFDRVKQLDATAYQSPPRHRATAHGALVLPAQHRG
ncbi:DUF4268 domain-containing protein [Nodosilinea sp. LEGE 07088]|uniref:DUF4268 domain-containing protein n=1 Tax=Nodosilinea sp. LEGE 07088 TaxID=2777968 RepID=UPI00187E47E2|nr:DUF4268 domain-containing protein [Nodosilinea sp. LEGE 07088]MBE9139356.1 DUF4268 domain-containing protein [Nodosilinea sp. LEGE 07088]